MDTVWGGLHSPVQRQRAMYKNACWALRPPPPLPPPRAERRSAGAAHSVDHRGMRVEHPMMMAVPGSGIISHTWPQLRRHRGGGRRSTRLPVARAGAGAAPLAPPVDPPWGTGATARARLGERAPGGRHQGAWATPAESQLHAHPICLQATAVGAAAPPRTPQQRAAASYPAATAACRGSCCGCGCWLSCCCCGCGCCCCCWCCPCASAGGGPVRPYTCPPAARLAAHTGSK